MKKIWILMLLCTAVVLSSCSKKEDPAIAVTGVSFGKASLSLVIGSKETVKVTFVPENATNKNVVWKSSDPSVATVSATGEVTAVKEGTAKISVVTEDGGRTASCDVTVTKTAVSVTGVTLDQTALTISLKTTGKKLVATVLPENASDKTVTWTSSDPSVATVSNEGVLSPLALGTTKITVTTTDGAFTAECVVTVGLKFENEDEPGIDGSSWEKAYTIANKEQFVLLSTRTNRDVKWRDKYYKLLSDIDLGSGVWDPIGQVYSFKGHFDGGDHTVTGHLVIADSKVSNFGIFGYLDSGSEIKNLIFGGTMDVSAASASQGLRVGGIAGRSYGASVVHCGNKGNLDLVAYVNAGGIIGDAAGSLISACWNEGKITNSGAVGGIAGQEMGSGALIVGCVNSGDVVCTGSGSSSYVGGVLGMGVPTACWSNAAKIAGGSNRGAIAGYYYTDGRTGEHCYWKAISGVQGVGTGSGYTNYASFTGTQPDAAQIDAMNAAWERAEPTSLYKFDANGNIVKK